jgi:osmotically inducible protein OsmC
MAAIRRATAKWTGDLASGAGEVSAGTSSAFSALPVTWASRTEAADGRTSPEELLAAAHATCFSMSLASGLAKAGSPPTSLDVSAEVTAERIDGKWTVVASKLTVRGRVPGMDAARFQEIAQQSRDGCTISRALGSSVVLSLEASLDQ